MDIDIDLQDRDQLLSKVKHIAASRVDKNGLSKHNTGVYLQKAPFNALKGICSVPFNKIDTSQFFKIDFLNVNIYNGIRDEDHLIKLMNKEPIWELLEEPEFCDLLYHVNGKSSLLSKLKPRSVSELAMFLAIIRPSKIYLQKRCIETGWKSIESEIWADPDDGEYYYKKSHAHSYAVALVVQMNLICEELCKPSED